ncbi:GntR family transcriptional regulator [Psychrobacillus lasiicapitis]|uniref:GntR family transcriptional regulator n=1 Tax=Psychrobacillus lasiicapitis TaxID=1636719 RepID=A0A544T341_9BACI|nr:GntR family transcriptional regulator [Psychrobacillus lasiicapitis]TQR11872.1 GntR family transcriptional regulator [Psychrobacillus lasiicapitis]GGA20136.1 putative HTH-type transcriptional regulator YdhC [Psychrobacillus lasiicapitis]
MNKKTLQKAEPYYLQLQQTIKERIWSGFYKPGERLYEAQLAKHFKVSRSPVREAIRTLINEGLLTMGSNSQITVYEPSLQDVRDIYECRIALESIAVALTAEQATDEQLEELEETLRETQEAIKKEEKERIVECNVRFHELIIEISGNLRLKKIVEDLHSLTYYYRLLNTKGVQRATTILKGHSDILDAIKEKNAEKASKRLEKHTQEDLQNLIRSLSIEMI